MKPTKEQCMEWAKEAGIRPTFVCAKPDECPDDGGCCHNKKRDGVWVRDVAVQALVLRAYVEGQNALRAQLAQQEPVCWVLNSDIEYDGTTHPLTTINVCPANTQNWSPLYLHPAPQADAKDAVWQDDGYLTAGYPEIDAAMKGGSE